MSLGSILGQTPKADIPDMTASNVSFDPSSTSPIITTDNVQSALQQAATQISGAKSSATSAQSTANQAYSSAQTALNLARSLEYYKLIGAIGNYRHNESVPINTMYKVSVPWNFYAGGEPDLIVFSLKNNNTSYINIGIDSYEEATFFCGPDLNLYTSGDGIGMGWTSSQYPTIASDSWSIKMSTPDFISKINFINKYQTNIVNANPSSYYSLFLSKQSYSGNVGGGTYLPEIGTTKGTSTSNRLYFGGISWDTNNFYFNLYFNYSSYSIIYLNVMALKRSVQ